MSSGPAEKLRERIRDKGPLTFAKFMSMALYEPELGYYTSPRTTIGRTGDFYTSPHLHAIFGWMLGKQIEEMSSWLKDGKLAIIEQGPGKGLLAKDILDYLRKTGLYQEIEYFIVEMNPYLRERQKELLKDHKEKILWLESLSGLEEKELKGILISNELLDAFPVHVVEMTEEGLKEIYVTADDGSFMEILGPPSTPELEKYIKTFAEEEFPPGYRTEVNLQMKNWLRDVSSVLKEGFIITIDYGYPAWDYYSPERPRGTLLGYYRHQVTENFYENIGNVDLTAHVNFSALKKWGEESGLKCIGFCPQGTYLISAGIDELMAGMDPFELAKIKGLLLPGTIGGTHKVMVQYKGEGGPELKGFTLRNQKDNL